jgi:acetolactate synthase small subunit
MVTCLALSLNDAQSLECRALEDSQSRRRLTIVTKNKQYEQINKQYTKQHIISKQTVGKGATHCYERVSARIT